MGKMMKLAGEMKTKLPALKEELARSEYTSSVAGDSVKATVNGKMSLIKLEISPAVLDDSETTADILSDMVRAAVSSAQGQAARAAEEKMKELTGGMDIPGLSDMM